MATIDPTPGTMILLFIIGVVAAATMVVPGVSGSLVLMILGYYYGIINSLKGFFDALKVFDLGTMLHLCLILVPFGIGVLLGIFLIAKLITYLFEQYGIQTYCAIFGLILASPLCHFLQYGAVRSAGVSGRRHRDPGRGSGAGGGRHHLYYGGKNSDESGLLRASLSRNPGRHSDSGLSAFLLIPSPAPFAPSTGDESGLLRASRSRQSGTAFGLRPIGLPPHSVPCSPRPIDWR